MGKFVQIDPLFRFLGQIDTKMDILSTNIFKMIAISFTFFIFSDFSAHRTPHSKMVLRYSVIFKIRGVWMCWQNAVFNLMLILFQWIKVLNFLCFFLILTIINDKLLSLFLTSAKWSTSFQFYIILLRIWQDFNLVLMVLH